MITLLKYTRDTKISQPQVKKVSAAGLRFFPHHFGLVSAPGESTRVRELTEQKHNLLLTPPKKQSQNHLVIKHGHLKWPVAR